MSKIIQIFLNFFSLKNISLEEAFLLLLVFENFNFWTTLFLNGAQFLMVGVNICESQIKKLYSFDCFLCQNLLPFDSRSQNYTTEVTLMKAYFKSSRAITDYLMLESS